jgi:hypothetical protein
MMACSSTLAEMETALRRLIAEEAFADAQQGLEDFAVALESEINRVSGDSERLVAMRAQVAGFFAWTGARIFAHRACAESETARLRSLESYCSAAPIPVTSRFV